MSTGKYTLDEHGQPQLEPDLIKWSIWMKTGDRIVAKTVIDNVEVSTVFLGLDHGFPVLDDDGHLVENPNPVLWETMIFGGFFDGQQWRCKGNREQAEAQHAEVVAWLEKEIIFDRPETKEEDDG